MRYLREARRVTAAWWNHRRNSQRVPSASRHLTSRGPKTRRP